MPRKQKNEEKVEAIFQPNKETGISEWKTKEFIIANHPELKTSMNGGFRHGICWDVKKYEWDIKRQNDKERGKVLKVRTCGFSNNKSDGRPIREDIRDKLLQEFPYCRHCGNHKDLCIDHKDDTYKDKRVLNEDTQDEDDFQVLCNKCNKDLKHQINEKEKKTGKLHKVKELNINPFIYDQFDYPWEVGLTEYDDEHEDEGKLLHCKMYTYWYDIKVFHHKRDWFVILRGVNSEIKKCVKLIP